jgi:enamine deaminase RidA (YjgF/YER057c/UK114 family)
MLENVRFLNPDTMQKPPGYSHVVEVTGPGRTVYFAGQLGIDKSGRMGANAREQIEIAFENVRAALASVGASFEQVVKLNNYVVDIVHEPRPLPRGARQVREQGGATSQYHDRRATTSAPGGVVRG